MENINILNKVGYLTSEDRKEKLEHGYNYVTFVTNLDLTKPIKVIPYGNVSQLSIEKYSQDLASFMVWWTYNVLKDLNGFSGFTNVKFELDFELI